MLETQRMVLGGGMQVGEREVAGVAGLGEQGEIGQLQFCCQCGAHRLPAGPFLREPAGVGEAGEKQDDQQTDEPRCQA